MEHLRNYAFGTTANGACRGSNVTSSLGHLLLLFLLLLLDVYEIKSQSQAYTLCI